MCSEEGQTIDARTVSVHFTGKMLGEGTGTPEHCCASIWQERDRIMLSRDLFGTWVRAGVRGSEGGGESVVRG